MAITIQQQPLLYAPAYNDMVFVVSSSNVAQSNFKFIADVVINGVSFRQAVFPNPTYNTGVFNIGRIVENYVSSNLSTNTYGFQENTNSIVTVTVKFGEEYGTTPVVYPNLTSVTKFAWNSIFDFLEFNSTSSLYYIFNFGVALNAKISVNLTSAPSSGVIRDDENAWLYALNHSSGTIYHAQIKIN